MSRVSPVACQAWQQAPANLAGASSTFHATKGDADEEIVMPILPPNCGQKRDMLKIAQRPLVNKPIGRVQMPSP
jgi:hypothetical protein